MIFKKQVKKYERMEFTAISNDAPIEIIRPDGNVDTVEPFLYQPTKFIYDEHGYESLEEDGESEFRARYTPDMCGTFRIGDEKFEVLESDSHGYIIPSKKDARYFEYTDGTSFFPIGLNMAFPKVYAISSGAEFGVTNKKAFLGLRQYKRWFDSCAENGVNMVRLWIGHPYFTPDTEEIFVLDYKKLTLLDTIVEMARERGIKLKLTLEQFRYFDYDDQTKRYHAFCKRLHYKGTPCPHPFEWLKEGIWQDGWFYKIKELAKRYSGDTTIAIIELWNEMNCFSDMKEWCSEKFPEIKKFFPKQMVTNSYGSLDCEETASIYHTFCWDKADLVQVHRYLDQGAPLDICNYPIEMMQDAISQFLKFNQPVLIAETGAVNDCHSAEFRFYSSDDRGIIFADTVYTPVFCGSCGIGQIWHWDNRYIESKGHYKMFAPIAKLCDGVDFASENFEVRDYSNDTAYILALCGKNTQLVYIRSKNDTWQNTLRDMKDPETIDEIILPDTIKNPQIVPIWDQETATVCGNTIRNLKYGTFIKGKTI